MYRLAVDALGYKKGKKVEKRAETDPYPEYRYKIGDLYSMMLISAIDFNTYLEQGIIEKVPVPVWTDEDMMEFHEYCLRNFVPITGLSSERLLEEFKELKGQANEN